MYRLCAWRNAQPGGPVIPDNILTRPPSAELKPDQCDQDSLPPYEVLDAIIAGLVVNGRIGSAARGFMWTGIVLLILSQSTTLVTTYIADRTH